MLRVRLFGAFEARLNDQAALRLNGSVQELLCYLLVHRDRPHSREKLAALLWGRASASRSRKYLRQALWQLQTALNVEQRAAGSGLLCVESDSVALRSERLWLDVAVFERAFAASAHGDDLTESVFPLVEQAVELYRGDLLQGLYRDWCRSERERLQGMYLAMLDRLMRRCESRGEFDAGLAYGHAVLRCDPAHERTHRCMMRLRYLAGDRAGALRQYDRCVKALRDELGVAPAAETSQLYHQLRTDAFPAASGQHVGAPLCGRPVPPAAPPQSQDLLDRIEQIRALLLEVESEIRQRDSAATSQRISAQPLLRKRPTTA